jgi:hypothetical protein
MHTRYGGQKSAGTHGESDDREAERVCEGGDSPAAITTATGACGKGERTPAK